MLKFNVSVHVSTFHCIILYIFSLTFPCLKQTFMFGHEIYPCDAMLYKCVNLMLYSPYMKVNVKYCNTCLSHELKTITVLMTVCFPELLSKTHQNIVRYCDGPLKCIFVYPARFSVPQIWNIGCTKRLIEEKSDSF